MKKLLAYAYAFTLLAAVVAAVTGVATADQSAGILGCKYVGYDKIECEECSPKVLCGPDASTLLYPQQKLPLVNGEMAGVFARVTMHTLDGGSCPGGTCGAQIRRYFPGELSSNSFYVNGDGGPAFLVDIAQDSYIGTTQTGATANIVYDGGLGASAFCPQANWASACFSVDYDLPYVAPPTNPTVLSVNPTVLATTYATPQTIVIGTSTGAAAGTCTGALGTYPMTSCTPSGGNTVTCSFPAQTVSAGVANVNITCNSVILFPLGGGELFAQSNLVSTSPTSGPTSGGTAVTYTLNAGATGGCTIAPTLDSINTTSCVVVDDRHITAVSGVGSVGTGPATVTSPSSPTSSATWTYSGVSQPGAISSVYPDIGNAGTTIHGTTASCVGCTTSNTSAKLCGTTATLVSITNSSGPGPFTVAAPANSTQNGCNLVLDNTSAGGGATTASSVYTQIDTGLIGNYDMSCGVTNCYTLNGGAVASVVNQQTGNSASSSGSNQPQGTTASYNGTSFTVATYSGATQYLLDPAFPNTADPITLCFVGDAASSATVGLIAGDVGSAARLFSTTGVSLGLGEGSTLAMGGSTFLTSPGWVCGVIHGASSLLTKNNATPVTGTVNAGNGTGGSGLIIGGLAFAGANGITSGHFAQALIWNTAVTFPNSVLETYMSGTGGAGKWKTP